MEFGRNLSRIRKIWHLQQIEIGSLIDVNDNMVSNYENGKSYPRLPALLRIEEITGIPIYDLCTKPIDISLIPSAPLKEYKSQKIDSERETTNLKAENLTTMLELQQKLIKTLEEKDKVMQENMALQKEVIKLKQK